MAELQYGLWRWCLGLLVEASCGGRRSDGPGQAEPAAEAGAAGTAGSSPSAGSVLAVLTVFTSTVATRRWSPISCRVSRLSHSAEP